MEVKTTLTDAPCPIVRFNALVGGKYKLRILWELRAKARRYSEIERALVDATGGRAVTPRVLSRELKELAAAGLITRHQYLVVPPRVDYRVAPAGRALLGVTRAICRWAERSDAATPQRRAPLQTPKSRKVKVRARRAASS
jgi:DNA-binding HxlR family transcriptional regulator